MNPRAAKRCVIYARISISSEESVSIERQVEAAEQYAAARGWKVQGTFVDDGVSATHNKPEERAGWKGLLASPLSYDVVVIWKVDRLARRVLDFLHADEALQARKAGIVCVEDPIDMSTAQGRAFATMLAVFGEMEAAAISARVTAARNHLLKNGRAVGGALPYGWRNIPNPDGDGYVLAHDPDRIEWVREMAVRTLQGHTLYSTATWLDENKAPLSTKRATSWSYRTVERLLRNPILAGMTRYNPGTNNSNPVKKGEDQVLRGEDGLPVVDESIAILSVADWRRLVEILKERPRSRPAAMNKETSGALSGLIYCGDKRHEEPLRMWRTTVGGRPGYACPDCHQAISNFEEILVAEFLRMKGPQVRWTVIEEVAEGGAALLPEIERRLDELDAMIREASAADRKKLQAEQVTLLDLRDEKRLEAPLVSYRFEPAGTFAADWSAAETDLEKRQVIGDGIERVVVGRVGPGRRTEAGVLKRLNVEWKPDGTDRSQSA